MTSETVAGMKGNKRNLKALSRICLLAGIAGAFAGLGVMIAGGLCLNMKGATWAVVLFFAGIALFLAGLIVIGVSIPLELKYGKEHNVRGRAVSENSFLIGRTILTFLEGGIYVSRGKEEIFEEGRIIIPYTEVTAYHTCKRTRPKCAGSGLTYLKIPAHYLKEGRSGNVAYVVEKNDKFEDMLESHGAAVRDTRYEPEQKPKRMKSFQMSTQKRKKTIFQFCLWGVVVLLSLVGLGCWVVLARSVAAGAVIAATGLFTGIFTACAGYFSYRETIVVYDGGIYWKDGLRNVLFLPWAEVITVSEKLCGGGNTAVVFDCGYLIRGTVDPSKLYAYLKEKFPEKCEE